MQEPEEEISQLEMQTDQISNRLGVLQHRERVGELLQDRNRDHTLCAVVISPGERGTIVCGNYRQYP